MVFQKATRKNIRLREALLGPSGSGKTYTALDHATRLAKHFGLNIAVIDTEHGSASKYADLYQFDVVELHHFAVENYVDAVNAAADAGYGILIIDSLSQAWSGPGGLLEFVDKTARKMKTSNPYAAWGEATPKHHQLIETMLTFPGHLIVTMRTKMEYVQEKDPRTGKTVIRKVGMQPVQRDGLEYEFDIVGDIDQDHDLLITKTRCSDLADRVFAKPGENFAEPVIQWIEGAAKAAAEHERQQAERDEHQQLALKVTAGVQQFVQDGIAGFDVQAQALDWVKQNCKPATDIETISQADIATLRAALDDLTRRATANYRQQVEDLEQACRQRIGNGNSKKEIGRVLGELRQEYLVTPLDGKSTDDPEQASPHSLKKLVAALKDYLRQLETKEAAA